MTREQNRRRGMWGAASGLCLVVFAVVTVRYVLGLDAPGESVVRTAVWWVSGIAALGLGVTACRVDDDGTEQPHYLSTIFSGLREEWRRGRHA